MSTATSYSALLDGMWGPDGSEINDRLKKLQDLERMRKEREAKRQEMLKDKSASSSTSYRSRLRSREDDPPPSRTNLGLRRTISLHGSEDNSYGSDRYGGARPKFSSYSDASDQEDERPITDIFSDITASVIGSRPGTGSTRTRTGFSGYTRSYSNQDSNDSNLFSGIVRSVSRYKPGQCYERLPYTSRYGSRNDTNYSTDTSKYTFTRNHDNQDDYGNEQYSADNEGSQGEQQQEVSEVQEHESEDDIEGEEPRHFIERLKNQNTNDSGIHSKRGANHDYRVSTMPTIPPYKKSKGEQEVDSVDPAFDILSVAKDIRATFGVKSPKTPDSKTETFEFQADGTCISEQSNGDFVFSAKSSNAAANKPRRSSNKRKSTKPKSRESTNISTNSNSYTNGNTDYNNQDDVCYEIVEAEYNSSEDEGRVPLPESAFATETSDWNLTSMTPNKLDKMQEFFTGEEAGDDPEIYRELNGSMVRAEMERAILEMSQNTPSHDKDLSTRRSSELSKSLTKSFDEQCDSKSVSSDSRSTPEKDAEDAGVNTLQEKGKGIKKKAKNMKNKSRVEQIKSAKSSDSDNDSFKTASESESDTKVTQTAKKEKTGKKTPVNKQAANKTSSSADKSLSLSDKLAKLESMTQEKSRKQSISESDSKKPVPSYMAGTSASQKKQAKSEPAKTDKGLVKNVREIKKFVRENSVEPITPNTTPLKSQISRTNGEITKNVVMHDTSVQTDLLFENTVEVYVCKHCGKSSEDPIERPRTPSTPGSNAPSSKFNNTKKVLERNNSVDSTLSKSNGMKSNFSSSRESVLSNESSSTHTEERKYAKSKTANINRSYMKGTASSKLKTAKEQEGQKQSGVVTRSVMQRAKALESAAKPSARTNKPISRSRPTSPHNLALVGKMSKAKSVEQMQLIRNHVEAEKNDQNNKFERNYLRKSQRKDVKNVKADKDKKAEQIDDKPIEKTPEKKSEQTDDKPQEKTQVTGLDEHSTRVQTLQKKVPPPISPKPKKKEAAPLEKLDITPLSPKNFSKPPVSSPANKQVSSPKSQADETNVESKGQFTKLVDNPFIRNDAVKRRNSLRDCEESVWEKAEHRSRDSSLRRSNSSIELDSSSRSPSTQRSKTESREKSSLTQLSWSGSGSSSSLHGSNSNLKGSKSSLHDSNSSLNDSESAFRRSRSLSANSQTSQSSVLNLLTSPASTRNPSSGAIETDVDAAYDNFVKETNNNNEKFVNQQKHDEESVNKAHLEFAKQALNMLEFETIKRDSSNESDRDSKGNKGKGKLIENQGGDNTSNGSAEEFQRQPSKKDRKGKGFLKGKFFRK